MFDRIKYKKFARLQLKGRWTVPVLVMLLYEVIIILLKLPQYKNIFIALGNPGTFAETYSALAAADSSANAVGLSALTIVVQLLSVFVLAAAQIYVYIKMSRSPDPGYGGVEFLRGFWFF